MNPFEQEITRALTDGAPKRGPAHVLMIGEGPADLVDLIEPLHRSRHRLTCCATIHEAEKALAAKENDFDLVLLDTDRLSAQPLAHLCAAHPELGVIPFCDRPKADFILRMVRHGAIDVIDLPTTPETFASRVEAAVARTRKARHDRHRLARLKLICRQLNQARHDISEQLDHLCQDLVNAYQEMSEQMNEISMASEYRTLLRQELDIEDLLRTSLEYLLSKTGPTNAAVFLPEDETAFSLGAYVNYDCPRETISAVLERLGEAICPQLAEEVDPIAFEDAEEFAEWIGVDSGMLSQSQVIAYPCRHEGECMAIVVLFRSADKPFDDSLPETIDILRPIFAEQLATVLKIHHRAVADWPEEASDDELDFNDDFGLGFGGMAA
ncbi:MAG: GAF domain-containing protein [Phycisphaerales bacterium]|nr:MAG: GAF domain-containing protein [Phycisphaerales bacterium]